MRAFLAILLIGCVAAAAADMQLKDQQQAALSLIDKARKVLEISRSISKRQDEDYEAEERQEKDSYLEALEYSQNSAAIQGVEGGGIAGFFRPITEAFSEFGIGRAGLAAAIAAPVVALAGMALLAPVALGRRKRDLSALFGQREARGEVDAVDRLRTRVQEIYTDVRNSEDCMERFVCEVGSAAKNVYYKESILRVVSYFTPDSYKKYMGSLKSAVHTGDTAKCRNIKCRPIGL